MRVIGGEFRSRRLKSVLGIETRPTPDRLREALFNVLAPRIQDAVFLDVSAGPGAVGIDPPYEMEKELEAALAMLGGSAGLVIAQHPSRRELPETAGKLRKYRVLKQGDNALRFYAPG